MLNRPDQRQNMAYQSIIDFNTFIENNIDLKEEESAKDELHTRAEEISDNLWSETVKK
jgi:hypothetical protein